MKGNHLQKPPGDRSTTNAKVVVEGNEDVLRGVNVLEGTAHALVADGGVGGAAVGLEFDKTVAEGVVVGGGAHLEVREGEDAALASIVVTTSAEASGEVSEVTGVRAGVEVLAGLEVVDKTLGGEGGLADTVEEDSQRVKISQDVKKWPEEARPKGS